MASQVVAAVRIVREHRPWMAVAAPLAAIAVWLAVSQGAPQAATVYNASVTVGFSAPVRSAPARDVAPIADHAPRDAVTSARVAIGDRGVVVPSANIRLPFAASVASDGRTVTFRARGNSRKEAIANARASVRRFTEKTSLLPLSVGFPAVAAIQTPSPASLPVVPLLAIVVMAALSALLFNDRFRRLAASSSMGVAAAALVQRYRPGGLQADPPRRLPGV